MLGQAVGFAFLAALSPGAVVVVTAYLGAASPRRTVFFFLLGALVMTVAAGIVVVVALHAGGLNHPHQRQPRYGLRLGLGVLALGASIAAVQAIGTARASTDLVAGALALVVLIDVMLAWVPLVLFILRPDATARRLQDLHDWLGVHGHAVLVGVLALAGILLVVDGAVGLAV